MPHAGQTHGIARPSTSYSVLQFGHGNTASPSNVWRLSCEGKREGRRPDRSEDEEAQGICPCGWHIPDDDEFKQLEISLGMTREEADMDNTWRGDDVGKQLLNGGTSGYNALLSGRRTSTGKYDLLNSYEYMWTSSEAGSYAWRRCLRAGDSNVGRWNTFPKSYAFSIRCVRDRRHGWNQ